MTSTEIELHQNGHLAERDIVDGWLAVASDVIKLANVIAPTDFVPDAYRDNPPAVAAAILTGRELGIGPLTSLRHVQVVKGTPTLSAEYKRARVLAAGHEFDVLELTTQRCRVSGRRRGSNKPPLEITFTMDDAKTAGLLAPSKSGKPGAWQTRPRRMLFARAGSELCDFLFADVVNGLPTAEIVADGTDDDTFAGYDEAPGQAAVVASDGDGEKAAPRSAQRRTRAAAGRPTTAAPAAAAAPTSGPVTAAPAPSGDGPPLPPLPGEDEGVNDGEPEADDHATPGWVGLIVRHFERLHVEDRGVRLGYTAQIAGLDSLASTKDLTPEQAKTVLDTLARCKNEERLIAVLDTQEHAERAQDAHEAGSDE